MLKPNQPNSIFISAQVSVRYCTCTEMKIGKRSWRIVVIRRIRQSFFPSKVLLYGSYCVSMALSMVVNY